MFNFAITVTTIGFMSLEQHFWKLIAKNKIKQDRRKERTCKQQLSCQRWALGLWPCPANCENWECRITNYQCQWPVIIDQKLFVTIETSNQLAHKNKFRVFKTKLEDFLVSRINSDTKNWNFRIQIISLSEACSMDLMKWHATYPR